MNHLICCSKQRIVKRAELLIDTDVITSIELSKSLLSQAQSADDMLLSAKLHNLLGRANKKNNNINESLEHFLQSSVYYSKLNDSRNQIKASINYINILLEEKRYDELTTALTWVQDSGTWTNTETRDVRIKFAKNGGTAANGGSNTDKLMYVDDASLTYASALSSSAVDSFPYCTSFDTDLGDWTTEIVSGTSDWTSAASNTTTGSSSVDAYSGGGSAYYYAYNYSGHGSTLMSTAMDISSVVNPQVTFQLANPAWGADQETLQVWYKAAAGDAWTVLATYTE